MDDKYNEAGGPYYPSDEPEHARIIEPDNPEQVHELRNLLYYSEW